MPDERVKEIYDDAGKRRVAILRRESGSFYYQPEYFSEHPLEMCWIPDLCLLVFTRAKKRLKMKRVLMWTGS